MSHSESFISYVDEINRAGGTYHRMDLGDGLVVDGEYDMAGYLEHYGLPERLDGKRVLDVGTASGFFAFECARRGGSVTAIDVHDGNLFRDLRDGLGLEVDYVQMDLFDLESGFGEFDLVVCGSVLLHISDIFGAVRKMHSVCRGETLIATAVMDDIEVNGEVKPWCEFLGWRAEGGAGEYWTVWRPSMSGLASMCTAAGYSRVEQLARFTLCSVPGMNDYATPHGVVRAQI